MLSWPLYWTIQGLLSFTSLVILFFMGWYIRKLHCLELHITKQDLKGRDDSQTDRQIKDLSRPSKHLSLYFEILVGLLGSIFGKFRQQASKASQRSRNRTFTRPKGRLMENLSKQLFGIRGHRFVSTFKRCHLFGHNTEATKWPQNYHTERHPNTSPLVLGLFEYGNYFRSFRQRACPVRNAPIASATIPAK